MQEYTITVTALDDGKYLQQISSADFADPTGTTQPDWAAVERDLFRYAHFSEGQIDKCRKAVGSVGGVRLTGPLTDADALALGYFGTN